MWDWRGLLDFLVPIVGGGLAFWGGIRYERSNQRHTEGTVPRHARRAR